jgi:hypothetical protein
MEAIHASLPYVAIEGGVIAGLDPAIHPFSIGWMRGSSPRMTKTDSIKTEMHERADLPLKAR